MDGGGKAKIEEGKDPGEIPVGGETVEEGRSARHRCSHCGRDEGIGTLMA